MIHQVHVYCIDVPDTPTAAVTHIQTSTVRRVPLFPNVTLRQKREIKPPSLVYCFVSAVPPADPHTHVRTHPPTTKSHTTNMNTSYAHQVDYSGTRYTYQYTAVAGALCASTKRAVLLYCAVVHQVHRYTPLPYQTLIQQQLHICTTRPCEVRPSSSTSLEM